MRELTPGLKALRDALAQLLADLDGEPPWADLSDRERLRWIDQAEELLEEPDTFGLLTAVDTLTGEGFVKGASPGIQVLLAEMQQTVAGQPTDYGTGFQDGLGRAIEVLAQAEADKAAEAYRRGFRDGQHAGAAGSGS